MWPAASWSERKEIARGRGPSTIDEDRIRRNTQQKYFSRTPGSFGRAVGHFVAGEYGAFKTPRGWEFFGIGVGANTHNAWTSDFKGMRTAWGGAAGKGAQAKIAGSYLLKKVGFQALPAASFLFAGYAIWKGYDESGIGGAVGAAASWGVGSVGFSVAAMGIGRTFRGSGTLIKLGHTRGLANVAKNVGRGRALGATSASASAAYSVKMAPALGRAALMVGGRFAAGSLALLPAMAAIGHVRAATGRASRDIDAGHRSLGINTSSSLAAFSTKGAYTSRQMSVQAIQRSHLNARSALGNEAQYMHRRGS